jgi:hypothetical protein
VSWALCFGEKDHKDGKDGDPDKNGFKGFSKFHGVVFGGWMVQALK